MANTLYPNMGTLMLGDAGGVHALPDFSAPAGTGIQSNLIDLGGAFAYNTSHQDIDDLSDIVTNGTATLLTPTVTNGVFDAANTTHSTVSGNTIEAVVLAHNNGTSSTSPLIAYYDTDTGGAISITPNSGDIVIEWGASLVDLIT